jgi:death on curing protein
VTVYLELEEVLAIHDALVPAQPEIRDIGVIQSALGRPQASAFGEDAYPAIFEKAAALIQSLACNHGWVDGNKRTAWVATMTFLEVNGHCLDPGFDQADAEELVVAIAGGRISEVSQIASELPKYTLPPKPPRRR